MGPRVLILAAGLALAACGQQAPQGNQAAPAPPPAAPAPSDTGLDEVTGLEIQYYDVTGDSLFAVRQALNRVRPRDPNDGLGVDALSSWYLQWRWPVDAAGACDLARAELRFSARIRMPRLVETASTPPAVRARWQAYVAALRRHEARHIRNAWDNRGRVLAAIRRSSCANANADARAVLAELARRDLAYDRATRHGILEGAHFP